LSDLGAEVSRVRGAEEPDGWPLHHRVFLEAGKRPVQVTPGSQEWHVRLTESDVLLTTGSPDELRQAGLDPEETRARHPRLVHTHISGFGMTGPRAGHPHSDLTRLAAGGLLYLAGDPRREPVRPYPEQSSVTASLHAAVGTLLALRRRDQTGLGDFVDVSSQEAVAHSVENAVQYVDLEGTVRHRAGAGPVEAGTGLFRCADGWMYLVTSIGGKHLRWDELAAWLAEEGADETGELVSTDWDDPDYGRSPSGVSRYREVVERFMATRSKRDLYEEGQRRGISLAPVSSPQDLLDSPQLAALDFFVPWTAEGREIAFPGSPYQFSTTPVAPRRHEGDTR
jgi:benzylsuccinate CoA-transferase BbsE subunit